MREGEGLTAYGSYRYSHGTVLVYEFVLRGEERRSIPEKIHLLRQRASSSVRNINERPRVILFYCRLRENYHTYSTKDGSWKVTVVLRGRYDVYSSGRNITKQHRS